MTTHLDNDVTRIVQRGLWFEEFELGAVYEHRPGRTITEAGNAFFAGRTDSSAWEEVR